MLAVKLEAGGVASVMRKMLWDHGEDAQWRCGRVGAWEEVEGGGGMRGGERETAIEATAPHRLWERGPAIIAFHSSIRSVFCPETNSVVRGHTKESKSRQHPKVFPGSPPP